MKNITLNEHWEVGVIPKGALIFKSDNGKYFIDGPYNIVQTPIIEVIPLSELTDIQYEDIVYDMKLKDGWGQYFTAEEFVLQRINDIVKSIGYSGLREPGAKRLERKFKLTDWDALIKDVGLAIKQREFDNSVPESQVVLKKK